MAFAKAKELQTRRVMINTLERQNASIYNLTHRTIEMSSILPFRVRFQNIGLGGYSESNVPPIGIAIVGFNNYIL